MKGQYFSFDAIIASLIFIMAIVSLVSYWQSLRTSVGYQNSEIVSEAFRISNNLMSQGFPPYELCQDMEQAGLALENGRISSTKLVECSALTEEELKEKTLSPYNITVQFIKGADVFARLGPSISDSAEDIVRVRRIVSIYNETTEEGFVASMDVYLYR